MACSSKQGLTEISPLVTKKCDNPLYKQGEYLCKEMFPCKLNDVCSISVLKLILKD